MLKEPSHRQLAIGTLYDILSYTLYFDLGIVKETYAAIIKNRWLSDLDHHKIDQKRLDS